MQKSGVLNFGWDLSESALDSFVTEKVDPSSGKISYLLGYPCGDSNSCSPIYAEFPPGKFLIELWGSQGGNKSDIYIGGKGAYTKGYLSVSNFTALYFFIGQKGKEKSPQTFNGGGSHDSNGNASSGGGATDVRLLVNSSKLWSDPTSLASRIMVAAGGGGSSYHGSFYSRGGDGGALIGFDGGDSSEMINSGYGTISRAKGGTQSSGGPGGVCLTPGTNGCSLKVGEAGSLGKGGNSLDPFSSGGGGGLYGGGASAVATHRIGSGAGGSSFISGYHNSPVGTFPLFQDPEMIDGRSEMPIPSLSSETLKEFGHQGNGAARITIISLNDASHLFTQKMKTSRVKAIVLTIAFYWYMGFQK